MTIDRLAFRIAAIGFVIWVAFSLIWMGATSERLHDLRQRVAQIEEQNNG